MSTARRVAKAMRFEDSQKEVDWGGVGAEAGLHNQPPDHPVLGGQNPPRQKRSSAPRWDAASRNQPFLLVSHRSHQSLHHLSAAPNPAPIPVGCVPALFFGVMVILPYNHYGWLLTGLPTLQNL